MRSENYHLMIYLLSALDYINADKINSNDCFLLDNEIVETVRPNPNADDLQDKEEIISVISLTEVLVNVENLINLYNFPSENFEITNEELRILKGIKCKVLRYKSESSIQLSMNEFIKINKKFFFFLKIINNNENLKKYFINKM